VNTVAQPSPSAEPGNSRNALAFFAFFCIALAMFGDLIFQMGDTVGSHRLSDGSQYFSRMRDFGFSELAKGNMPLWNPHIYSGTPFVGAFQSGMFYPPNVVYLVLPLANAMNVDAALHIFLMSVFMFMWARKQGLSTGASFVGGIVLAYGGASFMRVMAGHITMLEAFTWAPLILLSIDHVVEKRSNGWMLIGIGATTLQILAGYPPSSFMTAIAAGLYCCLKYFRSEKRKGIVTRLAAFCIWPPLMACVQLWTGFDTAKESMRSAGVSYDFATTFSFHPESLLSLLMPAFFGNGIHVMYWGRWAFWDSTIFVGIGGLVLILSSLYYGPSTLRKFSFSMLVTFVFLAFGSNTPVYSWLFEFLPGFDNFRSPSKFMFPASLFAAMLAAMGVDALLQQKISSKKIPILFAVVGFACLAGGVWIVFSVMGSEPKTEFRDYIDQRDNLYDTFFISMDGLPLPKEYYVQIARLAFLSCVVAATTCFLLCAVMLIPKKKPWAVYAIPFVTVLEILIFARIHRPTFDLSENSRPDFDQMYVQDPGDYRVMDVFGIDNSTRNYAVEKRKNVIWGYDPVILDRYAQFVVFAGAKRTLDQELLNFAIWGSDPLAISIHKDGNYTFPSSGIEGDLDLFRLLRCRYIVINPGNWDGTASFWKVGGDLPRFYFSNAYSVHDSKDSLLGEMKKETFQPDQEVLLESEPSPKPAAIENGDKLVSSLNVLSESTDSIEFDIQVDHNTLLVITDSYSKNWKVASLSGSSQESYEVMPVDYTLRGIPLAAGSHHFILEYAPKSYTIGRWISLASLIAFLFCCVAVSYKRMARPKPSEGRSQ